MHHITLQRDLPFSPEQLLDLALDVEQYDQFVPYCEKCVIREISKHKGKEIIIAAMTVGVTIFNETFVSRIIADREAGTIKVRGIDGPLNALVNEWTIQPMDSGSRINFHVSFEFKSKILSVLASNKVEQVCDKILDAFLKRANDLYRQNRD